MEKLLVEKPKVRFERDGDRYIVMLGDDRTGFVRKLEDGSGGWIAEDNFMSKNRIFYTRKRAAAWLQKETEAR